MARNAPPEPEFFIDRSLGKSISAGLREAGLKVQSMADVYGERTAQGLRDEAWLRDAGRHGWVVLTKDDRIRRRPAELEAFIQAKVRVFCLPNANLRGEDQIKRFVENRYRLIRIAQKPGPYIYGVYPGRVKPLWLPHGR